MDLDAETITEQLRSQQSDLRAFARREFAEQRETMRRIWAMDEAARVREGHCLAGLAFERRTEQGHLRFRVGPDETDFREGDFLRLHTGDPLKPLTECSLVASDPEWLAIAPFKQKLTLEPGENYRLDRSFFDLENMVLQAIDGLGATIRGRERILPLLLGDEFPDEVDADTYEAVLTQSESQGFNDRQAEAIANGAACDWCSLIQGPPGTGKTRVLAQIVANRLAQGERVLITAFTHRAIHQALRTLKQLLPAEERIAKVGDILPDPELPVPQYEYFADCPFAESDPGEGYVVGATVFACRSQRLKGYDFDTLVIDEAVNARILPVVKVRLCSNSESGFPGDLRGQFGNS